MRGTLLRIDLPVSGAVAAPTPRAPLERTAAARILVVDDEPVLTRIAARVLRGARYTVHTAQNGADALQRYQRARDFDLVLLDATMPGISGYEVLQEILRRDPQARVLVMSGYTGDMAPHQLLSAGARRFLPKPFAPQELLHAVQTVLDEGEAPGG